MSSQISNDVIDIIRCSLSDDSHFCKDPVSLRACSHAACRSCLIKENKDVIKCNICNKTTTGDVKNDAEAKAVTCIINSHLSSLFSDLEEKLSSKIGKIRGIIRSKNDSVEAKICYLEEELTIRIESIKAELDGIFERFKNDLYDIKKELIESNSEIVGYNKSLEKLKTINNSNKKCTIEDFFDHQENLIKLNEMIKDFNSNPTHEIHFNVSDMKIDDKMVGELCYKNPKTKTDSLLHFKRKKAAAHALLSQNGNDAIMANEYDFNRAETTFRLKITELSKFQDSRESRLSQIFMVRNLPWRIFILDKQRTNKGLGFFLQCNTDSDSTKWSVSAVAELRLLHQTNPEKNYVKKIQHVFFAEEHDWGYSPYLNYKDIMALENGYYNGIEDSITLEVWLNADLPNLSA